jgi:chromosomal replication initiator protein
VSVRDAQTLWDTCSEGLRDVLPLGTWMGCIQPLEPLTLNATQLDLSAPSLLIKERIEGEYRPTVLAVLEEAAGQAMEISVCVISDPAHARSAEDRVSHSLVSKHSPRHVGREPTAPSSDSDAPYPTLSLSQRGPLDPPVLNPDHTFDSFVTGANNRFAAAAAMAVAETPARSYNPLFIYGGVGLGKTHLLHAIGHLTHKLYPHLSLRYVTTEEFTNSFIQSIRHGDIEAFKRTYRRHDVLLVDDIQFLERKEGTQEEFFHTFNSLRERGGQIVITSDGPPKALVTLEERLRSRFEWGLTTDIQPPDFETRMAILRYKSERFPRPLSDDVLSYIAQRVEDNIRELEGALIRIGAYAKLYERPISVELADQVLGSLLPTPRTGSSIDPGTIVSACARHFGMSTPALLGRSRTRPLVTARHVAMYLCRELTELSLVEIGKAFGRDHTTVMYANEKVAELMATRPQVYQSVETITHLLKDDSG